MRISKEKVTDMNFLENETHCIGVAAINERSWLYFNSAHIKSVVKLFILTNNFDDHRAIFCKTDQRGLITAMSIKSLITGVCGT